MISARERSNPGKTIMKIRSIMKGFGVALVVGSLCILPCQGQNIAIVKKSAQTAAAGVAVSTVNGKTTLTYKGKEVWSGKTTGKVTARQKVVNGTEYVAAFDGTKVIWENVKGAGNKIK